MVGRRVFAYFNPVDEIYYVAKIENETLRVLAKCPEAYAAVRWFREFDDGARLPSKPIDVPTDDQLVAQAFVLSSYQLSHLLGKQL